MNHQDTINDEEEERYGAGGKTKRPRKADTESLTYLRSLEPDLDASLDRKNGRDRKGTHKSRDDDEGVGGGDDEEDQEEDQEMMVGNVVEELSNKVRRSMIQYQCEEGSTMGRNTVVVASVISYPYPVINTLSPSPACQCGHGSAYCYCGREALSS